MIWRIDHAAFFPFVGFTGSGIDGTARAWVVAANFITAFLGLNQCHGTGVGLVSSAVGSFS